MAPHFSPIPGGRIDWTHGTLIAEGLGRAKPGGTQQRLMARRAAEVVAARNAIAAANGIWIDAAGRVSAIRSGQIGVQGIVRGQQVTNIRWQPTAVPPECRLEMQVPLWGIDGVASLFWRTRQVQSRYSGASRIHLSDKPVDSDDSVLILDARGYRLAECLFPAILDADGRILYDVGTMPTDVGRLIPAVRYVESRTPFEEISTTAGGQRHYTVVRVSRIAAEPTDLVLTAAEANRLAQSPQTADAIRHSRLWIVVDPAAQ